MGKNQGFLSVIFSKARDNSTWAVSWLAELTVTPSPLPLFPFLFRVSFRKISVCRFKTSRVCPHHARMVTHVRGVPVHTGLHTEVFFCVPSRAPHHTTHTTQHHTETETERDRERRLKQRETEKERQAKTRKQKTRQENKRQDNKREETRR